MNLLPYELMFSTTPIFILVLCRVAGIMIFAPVLGSTAIPLKIKGLIALVLTIAVFPMVMQADVMHSVVEPNSLFGLAMGVAFEMVIGVAMGFTILLIECECWQLGHLRLKDMRYDPQCENFAERTGPI